MKILKRIKKAYQVFTEPEGFKWSGFIQPQNEADGTLYKKIFPVEGDGKAEFLGEGTTEEWEDMIKEDKGEKGWYDRIKNML